MSRAVVLISGGGGNSPFTTPDQGCATGLAAGGQLTGLRTALLDEDLAVYTCPARVGGGIMDADPNWGAFADGPGPLPVDMTINSVAPVSESGERLARFVTSLHETAGVTEVDFIGYSLGGVIGRAGIKELRDVGSPVRARSLISIGTPWFGSFVIRYDPALLPLPRVIVDHVASFIADVHSTVAEKHADSPPTKPAWADGYDHVLDGLPLTRIAGVYFPEADLVDASGVSHGVLAANDGHCTERSALAIDAEPAALPPAACFRLPELHSNYLADLLDMPWERSINWSPQTYEIVIDAIRNA